MSVNNFKERYDDFKCNLAEKGENNIAWNEEEYGRIEAYYEGAITNALFSMLFSDDYIQEEEVMFLNDSFGYDYDTDKVQLVYATCGKNLEKHLDDQIYEDIKLLKEVEKDLSEEFKDLLLMACNIIIESDGEITEKEKKRAEELISKLS